MKVGRKNSAQSLFIQIKTKSKTFQIYRLLFYFCNALKATLYKILNFPLVVLIRFYQLFISPLMGKNCRYQPTCSHYMLQAIKIHGPIFGFWLGIKRVGRCHPWGGHGNDPVPPKR